MYFGAGRILRKIESMNNETQVVADTEQRPHRIRELYRWRSRAELEEIIADPNRWVAEIPASQIMGIPRGTLRRFRMHGRGPRYRKVGGAVRYKVTWLLEYIAQTTVETSESGPTPACHGVEMHG
jgi:hypothetical protein